MTVVSVQFQQAGRRDRRAAHGPVQQDAHVHPLHDDAVMGTSLHHLSKNTKGISLRRKLGVGLGLALSVASLSLTATASAQVDPAGCPQDVTFDPAIRTWSQVFPNSPLAGNNATGSGQRHLTADLYTYAQAVMADAAQSTARAHRREGHRRDRPRPAPEVLRDRHARQHRQPRRRSQRRRVLERRGRAARCRRARASRPCATVRRSPGSRPPRTAPSRPRARPSSACSTSWPRARTAPTSSA